MKNLSDYLNTLLLIQLGDHDLIKVWWTTPNAAFEGQCPQDVNKNTVKQYLESHCFR